MINFHSTNDDSEKISFSEALLRGQAPDKGLYIPEIIPKLSPDLISSMKDMNYYEIASIIISKFANIPDEQLLSITKEAYNFEIPLEKVSEKKYLMRLDKGPTLSFKDFAARVMARLFQYYLKDRNKNITILTATSGDTGSAVANAFHNLDGIKIIVLFPEKEVTDMQRKQMTTLGGNIIAVSMDGKFDDCQAMVKKAFVDSDLKQLNLSSANSINIGRLIPQAVYYFYAYSRLAQNEEIIFSVPSGNFGDLMGGLIAKNMGLPVKKFIAAVNENDEFPNFLETEEYIPLKPSKACISNAMNVGHPSNLVRLVALYGGKMDEKGNILEKPDLSKMKNDIFSISISDDETRQTIKQVYKDNGVILEPHGAVGWAGLNHFSENNVLAVCLETADPAKFPEEVNKAIGVNPKVPDSLRTLENKDEHFEKISNYEEFKELIQNS